MKNDFLGEHPATPEPGERGRVQLCARVRVLQPQEPHLPRLRDAGAEPLRLPQAEQVPAHPAQVHQANHPAGKDILLFIFVFLRRHDILRTQSDTVT